MTKELSMTMEKIPFRDFDSLHKEIEEELITVFREALRSGKFVGGPMVEGFEKDFARFCKAEYCIGVGSGTDALRFALLAAGVGDGDIAITVPNTFIATTEAISQCGGLPVFVDIDERTYNLDVLRLKDYLEKQCKTNGRSGNTSEKRSGKRVAAVVPVHLYGQMTNMDPLLELAKEFNLAVVEDACQAHGSEYFSAKQNKWAGAGTLGKAGAFSFYPGKNLGAFGEAGAVITDDIKIDRTIRTLRDHGQSAKYVHEREGYNGRLDAVQAGILGRKLAHLSKWNSKRTKHAKRYHELLKIVPAVIPPFAPEWAVSNHHLFVVRVKNRDGLREYLASKGIDTGLHYPIPLHLQDAYKTLGYAKGSFPVAEKVASEILSLPMFPHLTESHQEQVVERISEFYRHS